MSARHRLLLIAPLSLAASCSGGEQRTGTRASSDAEGVPGGVDPNAVAVPASDPLLVQTASGAVRGVASAASQQFLGIPYAAPPVGALRWAAPVPPEPWADERTANRAGPICLQRSQTGMVGDEDCLSLDVHRPAQRDPSARLPVLVWIHGGSFVSGAGSLYDPRRLVEQNQIIVVTVNYRLGVLGFLALPSLTSESSAGLSGNYGLLDQQAALRWVRANIAAFGGDPEQVTLAGQSAGGASVCAQLASPLAAGLFSRAIIQSASCASGALPRAEAQGTRIAEALGCGDPASAAECLRALPAQQLAGAAPAAVFGPVVGGDFLPLAPYAVVLAGLEPHVPVLVGGLSDEMRGFTALEYPLAPARYPDALVTHFPGVPADEVAARYPLANYPEPYAALTAALSDSGAYLSGSLGGCVTETLARTLSASTPTYAYELDDPGFVWSPSASPVPLPAGASHSSDLAYLFDTVGLPLSEPFTAAQQALAGQMVRAWGAFIRSGDPNTAGVPDWPRYDAAEQRMLHLEPDAVTPTGDFHERHQCGFWQQAWTAAAASSAAQL